MGRTPNKLESCEFGLALALCYGLVSGISDLLCQSLFVWITPGLMFGEHQFFIDRDVENTASTGDQLRVYACGLFDPGSQTDRSGFVVSLGAVRDRDVSCFSHRATPAG